jgi:hypothetical protein
MGREPPGAAPWDEASCYHVGNVLQARPLVPAGRPAEREGAPALAGRPLGEPVTGNRFQEPVPGSPFLEASPGEPVPGASAASRLQIRPGWARERNEVLKSRLEDHRSLARTPR